MTASVILIDFDNIFITLWQVDSDLALRFAHQPMQWMAALANDVAPARRWLVARCYLNPSGWVSTGDPEQPRLYFSRFRSALVRAGFEVVDCPPLSRDKNAADIRIVIDALDLLNGRCHYDEFVIGSGDSDFTPLLHRLRAHDRRVALISPGISSTSLVSLADTYLDFDRFEQLVWPHEDASVETAVQGEEEFATYIRARYEAAAAPLNMSSLANGVAVALPGARASDWFGMGSFTAAVSRLSLPNARFSQHHLRDETRHADPQSTVSEQPDSLEGVPQFILALQRDVDLPRLPREVWPQIFAMLARYADEHVFNLTEATRWTRDELALAGTLVGRVAIGFVVRGAEFGGVPLNGDPAPSGPQIAGAFYRNLLFLAQKANVAVAPKDEQELAAWLGLEDQP